MTIQIYNILTSDKWKQRVIDSIPEIVNSGHHNAKNYVDLEFKLNDYECFTVLVENDKLLAISGLYNGGRYPNYTARILDRTYYYDWNKNGGMFSPFNNDLRYNSFYVIPYQMEVAKARGFSSVFISMQNPKKRRALEMMTNRQPQYKFKLLPDLYNTCKCLSDGSPRPKPECWQSISIHYLTEFKNFDLKKISIEEYHERYKDTKGIR